MERLTYFESGRWLVKIGDTEYSGPVSARLAAYEDTGLEPEEVMELAQAEKDGRLVVLPCKRGDTLWAYRREPSPAVFSFKVTGVSTLDRKTVLNTDILHVISASEVGKTVFLTCAEAEAALKRRKGEQNETC